MSNETEPTKEGDRDNRRHRKRSRHVLFALMGGAILLTLGQLYYERIVIPGRPLNWTPYVEDEFVERSANGQIQILMIESPDLAKNIRFNDYLETPEVRRLVRQLRATMYRLDGDNEALVDEACIQWSIDAPPALLIHQGNSDAIETIGEGQLEQDTIVEALRRLRRKRQSQQE